ncbi:DUF4054 domain-containing protein [Salmonella enterica subsp. salamae]|nr:DUF4054 domain-containing protein [Salmonella enterica subsp. salamae]EDW4473575.1 DUF4054 domain-containing protein [Salmonella enterica subsp. salamae]
MTDQVEELPVADWLAVIMPWYTPSDAAIAAFSQQCINVYDLDAVTGYQKTYMQALYVAAMSYSVVEGSATMTGRVTSKKEGDVSVSYAAPSGSSSTESGWRATPFGQEFIQIIRASRGGAILIGHAS